MRKQSSRQKKTVKWDIQQSFQSIVNEFVDNVINFSGLFLSGLTGIKLNLVEDLPDKVMFLKKRAHLNLPVLINDNSTERFLTVYCASKKVVSKHSVHAQFFFQNYV